MANITASDVKELRERTGAGMMECKKALVEAEGNMEKAEELIAKAGLRKAQKSAARTAAEGLVLVKVSDDRKKAAMVEINCETDFVAKDSGFRAFCGRVLDVVLENGSADMDELKSLPFEGGKTVEEARQALVAKIGENIQIRRAEYVQVEGGGIGAYAHGDRIGVLAHLSVDNPDLAKDVAMHVAAMNPQYLTLEDVPAELVAKEREIAQERAKESGKPANIIEKMVEGQVRKYLNDMCLVGQSFIKDPDKTVGQLLKESNAAIEIMIRYGVGEGIEVVKKSFQEEVMEQARGN